MSKYTYQLILDAACVAPTWALWLTWQVGPRRHWEVED